MQQYYPDDIHIKNPLNTKLLQVALATAFLRRKRQLRLRNTPISPRSKTQFLTVSIIDTLNRKCNLALRTYRVSRKGLYETIWGR
jgi:hypothetical protein